VNKKYSTRYYLSLVLIDEGEFYLYSLAVSKSTMVSNIKSRRLLKHRITILAYPTYVPLPFIQAEISHIVDARRYFKQSEIVLYRQAPEIAPTPEVAQQQLIQKQHLERQQQVLVGPSKNPQYAQPQPQPRVSPAPSAPDTQQQAQATASA
jgi:hypothetical protein